MQNHCNNIAVNFVVPFAVTIVVVVKTLVCHKSGFSKINNFCKICLEIYSYVLHTMTIMYSAVARTKKDIF